MSVPYLFGPKVDRRRLFRSFLFLSRIVFGVVETSDLTLHLNYCLLTEPLDMFLVSNWGGVDGVEVVSPSKRKGTVFLPSKGRIPRVTSDDDFH